MFDTYEQGHAQALADNFHGATTDFNEVAATYAFISGYKDTAAALVGPPGARPARADDHRIAEAMAATWDPAGNAPPRDWRVVCTCSWRADGLRGQLEAYSAHEDHRIEMLVR